MNGAAAEAATILRATVGSTVHGLNLPGKDDIDEMGICIEPPEVVFGATNFEQYIYRTAYERALAEHGTKRPGGQDPISLPGDIDLTIYSLRKFCHLAAKGNPSILVLLFIPSPRYLVVKPWGDALLHERDMFYSRDAGRQFLGYLRAQRERLLGRRGQMRVTRTAIIEEHGYDTKYAMHALPASATRGSNTWSRAG
jgi:predicted nucleotidyltransferase